MWIGGNKGCQKHLCAHINVKWIGPQASFRAHGVDFSTNLDTMVTINYNKVLMSICHLFSQWSKRNLTVLGRVTVVKSLILSKLTFMILSLPDPPKSFVKDLDIMLYKFIWKGGDRVSRNQMIQTYGQGGVKMIDLRSYISALKCTWIRRFLNTGNSGWATLFSKITSIKNTLILEGGHSSIVQTLKAATHPNQFWIDVLTA